MEFSPAKHLNLDGHVVSEKEMEKSRGFDHAKLKCLPKQKRNLRFYLQKSKLERNLKLTDFQVFSPKGYKMSSASDMSIAMYNKFDSLGLVI